MLFRSATCRGSAPGNASLRFRSLVSVMVPFFLNENHMVNGNLSPNSETSRSSDLHDFGLLVRQRGIHFADVPPGQAKYVQCFVGRILDWHVKNEGKTYTAETDPGVASVRAIYAYYKAHGVKTVVMGASFRNAGEIEALAGCDRLTIAPQLLEALSKDVENLPRRLDPLKNLASTSARLNLDEKSFRLALNNDAMATEKLAEGIRLFMKDLDTLRLMVTERRAAAE